MTDVERIVVDPDTVVTALQRKYLNPADDEPTIRVAPSGETELRARAGEFDQPDDAVELRPERFVGGLDLPDPDATLDDGEIDALGERLGSEVRPALKDELDIDAGRDESERSVPVEYPDDDP